MSKRIFLIEDHDKALEVWRKEKAGDLDLVHIDAHIDFGFYQAKPAGQVFREAKSLKELKRGLEMSLAFRRYESDFEKQTNIGNYIYPAIQEGIVRNFYWVVPGGLKEFRKARKLIENILARHCERPKGAKQSQGRDCFVHFAYAQCPRNDGEGIISTELMGRRFVICVLEKLPVLKQKVLLDIDTDFLVIDSLINANNTVNIGKRKPWITPKDLAETLKEKIKQPQIITIAYSVNGGYTPIKYKHLGDEIAYNFSSEYFKIRYANNLKAAQKFDLFCRTNKKEHYESAIKLNPAYRVSDNNYGPLYLALRKFSSAKREFLRILRVDPRNPGCLSGLGNIALAKKDFQEAKRYFLRALSNLSSLRAPLRLRSGQAAGRSNPKREIASSRKALLAMTSSKNQILFGLGRAEFELKNFKRAKVLFDSYQNLEPRQPESYCFLGRIYEKEGKFKEAAAQFQDAMRLGFAPLEIIGRLLKISYYLEEKDDIIKFIILRYNEFKKDFLRAKRLSLKRGKKVKGSHQIEKRMKVIEKRIKKEKEANERHYSFAQEQRHSNAGYRR